MYIPRHEEVSTSPSMLNTSSGTQGVPSQLANIIADNKPQYDNVKISDMRGNPMYSRHDDIDTIGLVQNEVISRAKILRKNASTIRKFNDAASKIKISSKY